jgi:hypothetical protein
MRTLSPPDPKLWQTRAEWFWRAHDLNAGPQPLDLDPRGSLLLAELEVVYCAGAWASTVILAWTLVEASLRRTETGERQPPPDVDWLREQRNGLVHIAGAAEVRDEAGMEALAQGALRVAFKTLYAAVWSAPR